MKAESEISEDAILGGALRVRQPLRGHRVGHDAILLAAATAARADEHAIELGAGVGAAGLALAARINGPRVTLVEIDRQLCALAADNARLNRLDDRVKVVNAHAEDVANLAAAGFAPGSVERVLMNPPFHDARRQNVSPDPLRRLAHVAKPGLLVRWVDTAAWLLKPRGVLTLIWRADELDDVLDALRPTFGDVAVLPVRPRADAPAIRVLVRAVKADGNSRSDYPALVLNAEHGKPTAEAEAILRSGKTLEIAES
ncbi:MAG TPA: methyltransferase [Pseudolabrys sp.]|nr:methyltransferase [Pseudolabrys sp.]